MDQVVCIEGFTYPRRPIFKKKSIAFTLFNHIFFQTSCGHHTSHINLLGFPQRDLKNDTIIINYDASK